MFIAILLTILFLWVVLRLIVGVIHFLDDLSWAARERRFWKQMSPEEREYMTRFYARVNADLQSKGHPPKYFVPRYAASQSPGGRKARRKARQERREAIKSYVREQIEGLKR